MSSTRSRLLAKNSVYSFASFAFPVLLTVIVTPVILHYIGTTNYGIFALASIFVSFLGLLDFGMAPSVTKFVSERVAVEHDDEAGRVVGASMLFYIVIGLLGLAISLLIAFVFLDTLFSLSDSDASTATFVFVVGGIDFLLMMVLSPLAAVPQSLLRYDITAK